MCAKSSHLTGSVVLVVLAQSTYLSTAANQAWRPLSGCHAGLKQASNPWIRSDYICS